MSTPHKPNRSMPPGTIIPELVYTDMGAAAGWLCAAFGFKPRLRIGNHRTQLTFGDASMIVVAASADQLPGEPDRAGRAHSIMVCVDDVDQHFQQAQLHGAKIISPPADYPFGERQYSVEDLAGHRWTFTESIADVDPHDWGGELVDGTT